MCRLVENGQEELHSILEVNICVYSGQSLCSLQSGVTSAGGGCFEFSTNLSASTTLPEPALRAKRSPKAGESDGNWLRESGLAFKSSSSNLSV